MNGIRRELFPIVEKKPYFNTCSIGPLSLPVKEKLEKYLADWDQFGGISWVMEDGWNETIESARELFAKIIGAKPRNIAYSFGNSVAFSSVLSGFDFNAKDNILFNEFDFPAFPSHIMAQVKRGVEYRVVQASKDFIFASDYERYIDDRTQLITTSEVASNTGVRIDVNQLQEISTDKDIPLFVDSYQSVGVIPIDVRKNDIAFLASGALKWLLGGFGMSFLYIRDDWIERLSPSSIGWMGVEDPFEDLFDKLRTKLHRPKDARKFQFGTPYPVGAVSAYEGMKIIDKIGIDKIFNVDMDITQRIIDGAEDFGLTVQTPKERNERGSIVNIKVNNTTEIVSILQNEGFILDMRSNGIRVAPHFFNNLTDVQKLLERINSLSRSM